MNRATRPVAVRTLRSRGTGNLRVPQYAESHYSALQDAHGIYIQHVEFDIRESDSVGAELRLALRRLWDRAFGDRFSADDVSHAYGGVHVIAMHGMQVMGHASAIPRRIQFGDGPWYEIGYVEAVAVDPDLQHHGLGHAIMLALHQQIEQRWPAAMLSTGRATGLYQELGWERWLGISFTCTSSGRVPDDEHGGLMVLRFGDGTFPDLHLDVTCEDRSGDAW